MSYQILLGARYVTTGRSIATVHYCKPSSYHVILLLTNFSSVPESWSPEEIAAFQDPWEQAYYQRALYTNNYVFAAPYSSGRGGSILGI